ncbi:hypothetical protein IKZ40_06335 [bacterium]|nr:hypothetical protein [bacterium]
MKVKALDQFLDKALRPLAAAFLLFLILLLQYSLRLQYGPGGILSDADSAKFACIMLEGGAAHTPLFPIYTLFLKFFGKLGIFYDPGARAAFFSAVLLSFSLCFLFDGLRRRGGSLLVAFLAAWAVSFLPFLTICATEATPIALSFFFFFLLFDLFQIGELPLCIKMLPLGLLAFHDPLGLFYAALLLPLLFAFALKEKLLKSFFLGLVLTLALGLLPYLYILKLLSAGENLEFVTRERPIATLLMAVFNGQFWNNYFCFGPGEWGVRFKEVFSQLLGVQRPPLFVAPLLLLGLFFAPDKKDVWKGALFFGAALLATLLFLVPSYHFYPLQWFWLLNGFLAVFTALALGVLFSSDLKFLLLPLAALALLVLPAHSSAALESRRSSCEAAKLAHTFGSLPYGSALLSEDVYTAGQYYRYYRLAFPELVSEGVAVTDDVLKGRRHFFFSPAILELCDDSGVKYYLFTNVDGTSVYELGEKPDGEE